jgi:tRNA 2-thiouridine synthesizing protein A
MEQRERDRVSNRWFGRPAGNRGRAAVRGGPDGGRPRGGPDEASGPVADGAPPPVPALTIDALGRKCPIPIIMLAERINEVPVGAVIAVLADDPAAENDVPAWCAMKSHDYVVTQPLPRGWAFHIRREY